MLALVLLGVASVLIVILWALFKKDKYKDEPPLCFGSKILLGHALLLAGTSTRLWSNIMKISDDCMRRGGALKLKVGFRTLYDPEDCTTVSNICTQKDSIYEFAKPWVGDGLVTSSASLWKVHRKLLNSSFNPHVVDNFIDAFNSKSRSFISNLKAEVGRGLFDQFEYTKMFALETVCLTTLGVDLSVKSAANTEFMEALGTILNILISRAQTFWFHSDFIFSLSSLKRKQDACIKKLHNMSNTIFYIYFIKVAGLDTFATALVFIIMFVGSNPQVQEKINELKSIFGDEDRDVTKQDLSQLVYLEAVIKESLRLYPPIPIIGRYLTQDVTLRTMLVLVLIGTVMVLWVWSWSHRNKNEPPVCFGSKMLIGNALIYTGNSVQLWNNIKTVSKEALERGGVLTTTIGPRVIYVVSDPEDLTTVANACLEKDCVYKLGKRWFGGGLVTTSVPKWKVHRKLLNPAFSQGVLDSFIDIFNDQSRYFVEKLKVEVGKGPFDHLQYTQSYALNTICSTAFGVDFREKNVTNIEFVETFLEMLKLLVIRFQSVWLHNNLLFSLSSLKRKQEECITILNHMSNTILKQRKESLAEEKEKGSKFKTFMDLVLELSHDTNAFTDQEVREHVDTFIVTGYETSATVLLYCILLVGSYSRVQEKIHDELKNVFGDEDRDITKQDLPQLVYLEAVLKESMRIYPIGPVVGRNLHKDIKLRNCTLLKGNSVCLSICGVNWHSMWGLDVEEFKPERWLDPSTLPDRTYTSASFSIGRRNCIGKTYAMMSLKITMAHFCRNYIVYGDHTKMTLKLDVLLKPFSGHHIAIDKRN